MILNGYILGIGYAVICLLLSLVLYKFGLERKYTRKVVHILVGFEWVILYKYMSAGIHFLTVCILFLILLTVAYKGRLMPMISSDDDNAPGTVYYAVAMTGVAIVGCFVPEIMLPFGIGVMCTSVGDGFAGVIGQLVKTHNPKIYGQKTIVGFLTNFVASAVSAFVISTVFSMHLGVFECFAIGLLSASLELITPYGFDNISITWCATALAYFFMYFDGVYAYILPILITPLIIVFAVEKKALTRGGIASAIVLDIVVSFAFGNRGFIILSAFFIGSVIIDKIKNRYKKQSRNNESLKTDCRDYMQVFANGLVAFASAVAFLLTDNILFFIPFVASMAEAFSDTVASGMGTFASVTYDPFRMRKCDNGISGGMSVIGTVSSLLASVIISFIAYFLNVDGYGINEFIVVAISGFAGAVFDSFLGSLLQVKYQCHVCGEITEREEHCDTSTVKYSGVAIIDNDVVNMISCAFSAILATIILIFV